MKIETYKKVQKNKPSIEDRNKQKKNRAAVHEFDCRTASQEKGIMSKPSLFYEHLFVMSNIKSVSTSARLSPRRLHSLSNASNISSVTRNDIHFSFFVPGAAAGLPIFAFCFSFAIFSS